MESWSLGKKIRNGGMLHMFIVTIASSLYMREGLGLRSLGWKTAEDSDGGRARLRCSLLYFLLEMVGSCAIMQSDRTEQKGQLLCSKAVGSARPSSVLQRVSLT